MNKTAIKNFAIGARNKLIADVRYRAGLVGITEQEIKTALPQSNSTTEFYDIGTASPYAISGEAIRQRRNLAESIRRRAADADYAAAYRYIMEEVAYTWFNRLIAVRFMEVNEYLPGQVRVLSSVSGKIEPDLVTDPFGADLAFSVEEERTILQLKQDNQMDKLFRLLFVKQCNALHDILPALFEQTDDYTELLLNLSVVDQEGVVWHLTHDIPEDDFNVEKGGQVEIIGWLYQYYNTEPKAQVFARPSGQKIKREEIPAATQLFTPDWIVRYMVENSLGRVVINNLNYDIWADEEKEKIGRLKAKWKYYLDEAPQDPEVDTELRIMEHNKYASGEVHPFIDTTLIDPCMGSGHILVYAFDVFMDIYKEQGWNPRDAAQRIVQKNIFGLDIDKRAYQLAYFAVMMKARQYDRRFLTRGIEPNVYEIQASSGKYPFEMGNFLLSKEHQETLNYLLEVFQDAKEYGSLLKLEQRDYAGLLEAWQNNAQATAENVNMVLWYSAVEEIVPALIKQALVLAQKYDVAVTNPPYMAVSNASEKMQEYVKKNYPDSKADLFAVFIERCRQFSCEYFAMITQHAWMFLSSFEKLRAKLQTVDTVNMVHLGARAFEEIGGEVVQTTAFVMRKWQLPVPGYQGTYCRLIEPNTQQGKEDMFLAGKNRYTAQQDNFSKIPGSPVAYWVGKKTMEAFQGDAFEQHFFAGHGLLSGHDESMIYAWYEVPFNKIGFNFCSNEEFHNSAMKYVPMAKGGDFRKWYGNLWLVAKYDNKTIEYMSQFPKFTLQNAHMYFKSGITWTEITSGNLGTRLLPPGCIFNHKGPSAFASSEKDIVKLAGFMSSCVANHFTNLINPTITCSAGTMKKVPVIDVDKWDYDIAQKCISISRTDWDSFETSWDFTRHPLVEYRHSVSKAEIDPNWDKLSYYLKDAYEAWEYQCQLRFDTLKANEEELNRIFIDIYGLQDELTPEVADKDVTVRRADLGRDIRSLLSYAVGCMFGRYSLDEPGLILAGYDKVEYETKTLDGDSPELEKFAKKNLDGSVSYGSYYHWVSQNRFKSFPIDIDNIIPITDEAYLEDDIVKRLCEWLRVVYGTNTLEENLDFIAKALGNKGTTSREVIRNYFLKDFFADHCKIYQKRPIYWLFDSGKQNGFKALVYLHRYTPDTIGKLRVDYLHRLQRVYASEIERMQDMIDNSKNQREVAVSAKRKEKLQKQLKECREYDEKIAHLALARIELDLDDGVKVNYEKVQTAADGKKYPVLGKI